MERFQQKNSWREDLDNWVKNKSLMEIGVKDSKIG